MNHLCITPDVRQFAHQSCREGRGRWGDSDKSKSDKETERRALKLAKHRPTVVIYAHEQSTQYTWEKT